MSDKTIDVQKWAKVPNRKPLRRVVAFEGEAATWEIRFGPVNRFRVFYEVDQSQHVVRILALGEKKGNRSWVG